MAFVEILGTDVHYIERGDGPPMLFLHGSGSCAEAWHQQFDAFSDHHRVIAYDSVNHGHSSNSPLDGVEPTAPTSSTASSMRSASNDP
jgi:pimeloyl-ACP methyl ester carboxylesterase